MVDFTVLVKQKKRKRPVLYSELTYLGKYSPGGSPGLIRMWHDKQNGKYYDCECGAVKPNENLSELLTHSQVHNNYTDPCATFGPTLTAPMNTRKKLRRENTRVAFSSNQQTRVPALPGNQPTLPPNPPTLPTSQPTLPTSQPTLPTSQPTLPTSQPTLPTGRPLPAGISSNFPTPPSFQTGTRLPAVVPSANLQNLPQVSFPSTNPATNSNPNLNPNPVATSATFPSRNPNRNLPAVPKVRGYPKTSFTDCSIFPEDDSQSSSVCGSLKVEIPQVPRPLQDTKENYVPFARQGKKPKNDRQLQERVIKMISAEAEAGAKLCSPQSPWAQITRMDWLFR